MTDKFTISADQDGLRLQDVLSARYPTCSVGSLLKVIAGGGVLVNRIQGKRRMRISEGDTLEVFLPPEGARRIEPRKMDFDVIYEDASCIVINKPAGLAVVPESEADDYPLMSGMLHYLQHCSPYATGEMIRPMIVHRLDKDTTGALVLAKTLPAMRHLTRQFEARTVTKEYLAIVRGQPPAEGEINFRITARRVKRGKGVVDQRRGQPALTLVRTEEYFRSFALVRAIPKTGRMHQIRLHLKAAGYPLAVDPLYSPQATLLLSELKVDYRPKPGRAEKPLITRQTLHAHRLAFDVQTESGEPRRVSAEAPLPADMTLVLKMLRKYRAP